jgi:hypothetical protein
MVFDFYINTTLIPLSQTSISKIKGFVKSGKASTGAVNIASFKVMKAYTASEDH